MQTLTRPYTAVAGVYHPSSRLCRCQVSRFTHGWTLQELIAPCDVLFFNSKWEQIGSKSSLSALLPRITTIPENVLRRPSEMRWVSVAAKMSWAATRQTTRVEDMAYCLLGIFEVNLPLLYGEEGNAFRRLQEEIIRSTTDLTIFAWWLKPKEQDGPSMSLSERTALDTSLCGVLAENHGYFAGCSMVKRIYETDLYELSISTSASRPRCQVSGTVDICYR